MEVRENGREGKKGRTIERGRKGGQERGRKQYPFTQPRPPTLNALTTTVSCLYNHIVQSAYQHDTTKQLLKQNAHKCSSY